MTESLPFTYTHLDTTAVHMEEWRCYVALSEDKSTIFICQMNRDGSPEKSTDNPGHLDWTQVTAPEDQGFLDDVNLLFGTDFRYENFAGR